MKKNSLFLSKNQTYTLLFVTILFLWSGCSTELKKTSIRISDPIRHYYPVLAGDKVTIDYEITNTGEYPLIISDVQSTCGCITASSKHLFIPEKEKAILSMEYNSGKNIGYVKHEIRLYGNFDTTSVYRMYFDLNVVPHADYTKDYEELYRDTNLKQNNKNPKHRKNYYYIDSSTKDR